MTRALWLIACLLIAGFTGSSCAVAQEQKQNAEECRHWSKITYPRLAVGSFGSKRRIWTYIANQCDWGGILVVFAVTDRRVPETIKSPPLPPEATAALRMEDGSVLAPTPCPLQSPERSITFIKGTSSVLSVTWSHAFFFRWQERPLQQAWVEIRAEEGEYWLELPYGFTGEVGHNQPSVPDAEGNQPLCTPHGASPPEAVPPDAEVVPWTCVSYKLDGTNDMWVAEAFASNPFDPECELSIRPLRDPDLHALEKWSLHEPSTAVTITDEDGTVRKGHATSITLEEEGRERRDEFRFSRYIKTGRCWGRLTVRVGDSEYTRRLPSSLYRSWHGHARKKEGAEGRPPARPAPLDNGP